MKTVDGCFEKWGGSHKKRKKKQKFFKNKLKLVYQTEIVLVGSANSILQIWKQLCKGVYQAS